MTNPENTTGGGTYERILDSLRGRLSAQLGEAALQLDNLKCSDLNSVLIAMSDYRAELVSANDILNGNKYHLPSPVDQRDMHKIESVFYSHNPNLRFVDISPVQPFGINKMLAGTSEKRVVAALRGSEVNADPTTALFRLAYEDAIKNQSDIRIATHSRSVRAQNFGENSKFMQHFKTFSEVTVGMQDEKFGRKELDTIAGHLAYEVECLQSIVPTDKLRISISNILFAEERRIHNDLDVEMARKEMRRYDTLHENVSVSSWEDRVADMGITRGVQVLEKFLDIIAQKYPQILDSVTIDLDRVGGLGYYKHVCYKIVGINKDGDAFPLADGGSTDWAQKVGGGKQMYTVTSGVGTEMLAINFGVSDG